MSDEIKEIIDEFLKEKSAYSLRYSFNGDLAYSQEQILKDYITNLQEENQRLTAESTEWESKFYDMQDNFHNANEEIEKLKKLCDKYEEEHNTTFKLWKMKMEEMPTYEEKVEMQKENQRLKEENNKLINEPTAMKMSRIDSVVADIYRNHREQEDYKSRCEKAIEYIKSPKICIDIRKTDGTLDFVSTDELLNILGDKE